MPKTLILNIGENPHLLLRSSYHGESAGGSSDASNIDEKLLDYVKLADIVNDLITEDPNKPLSASQGKELKSQLDLLKADVTKLIVEGVGIVAGLGVKVTVENAMTTIHIDIDDDSPLAFNQQNQLYIKWSENK